MEIEALRALFGWSTILSWVVLLVWWWSLALFGDWIHRIHSTWFDLPRATFDAIHYGGMAFFKIMILLFALIPYLVLRFFV